MLVNRITSIRYRSSFTPGLDTGESRFSSEKSVESLLRGPTLFRPARFDSMQFYRPVNLRLSCSAPAPLLLGINFAG